MPESRIELTGIGDKYAVRVATDKTGGLRFAITSAAGAKTHASSALPAAEARRIAEFILATLDAAEGE